MMKPLGLEGKVGAPAIVRTNPLLRMYDEKFVPSYKGNPERLNRLVDSFLPFSWFDVLEVIHERHEARDHTLRTFVHLSTAFLPDEVLVYDLDTPGLALSVGAGHPTPPNRLLLLRGSCHSLSAGPGVCPVIDGNVGSLLMKGDVAIIRKDLWGVSLSEFSCCLYAPTERLDAGLFLRAGGAGRSVLLTTAIVDYRRSLYCGSIHDPDESPDTREVCDLALSMADDPAALLRSMRYLKERFHRLDLLLDRYGIDPNDMAARSLPLDSHGDYYRFTPRGGSR